MIKYIVVIIPKINFYRIIFENEFLNKNEFRTQNLIIEILQLLGYERKEFICDLLFQDIKN